MATIHTRRLDEKPLPQRYNGSFICSRCYRTVGGACWEQTICDDNGAPAHVSLICQRCAQEPLPAAHIAGLLRIGLAPQPSDLAEAEKE